MLRGRPGTPDRGARGGGGDELRHPGPHRGGRLGRKVCAGARPEFPPPPGPARATPRGAHLVFRCLGTAQRPRGGGVVGVCHGALSWASTVGGGASARVTGELETRAAEAP